ncbi:hypothetical protein BC829DRAFT_146385 [Chytridium lagenaria]|nr:hypothetical protein BC829DRAFT_146385 [Chytridium lagenaria]
MALRERPMQVLAATDRDTLIDVAKTKRKPKYRHSTSSLPATPLKGFADFRQWRSEPNVLQNETRVIDLGSLTAKPLLNPARKTQQRGPSRASTPSAWNGSQNNVTVSKNLGSAGVMMPPPTLPSHVAVDKTFRNRITPSRTSLPPLATEPVSAPKSVVSVTETIPDALFDNPELGVDFDQQIVNEVTTVLQQDKCDGFLEPPAAFMAVELQDDFEEPEKFIGTPAPTCIFPVKVDPLLVGEGSKEALSKVLKPLVVRNVEFPGAKPARGAVPVKKVESTPLHTTDLQKTSQQRLAAEEKHTHDLYDAFQAKKRYKEAKQLIQVMWESRQRRDVSFLIPTQHPVALLDINMALNPPRKFIARPVISSAGGARSRLEAHSGSNAIGLSSLDPLPGIGADALRRQIWCPSKEDLSGTRSITSREGGEKGATRRLFSASRIWKNVSDRMQRHVIESATSIENTRKESDNKPTVDDWTDVHAGLVQSQGKGVEHSPQPISKPTSVHSITSLAILPHRRRRRLIHSEKRHPLLVRTFSAMRAISAPKSSKPKVTAYVNTQSGVRYVSLKRNRRPQPPIPKHVGKGLPEIMAEMNEVLNNLMFVHPEQGKMMVQREKVEGEEEEEKKGLKLRWRRRTRVPRCKDSEIEPVPKEDSDGVDEVQQDVGNSEFVEKAEKGPKVEKSGIAKKKMVQQARTDYDVS